MAPEAQQSQNSVSNGRHPQVFTVSGRLDEQERERRRPIRKGWSRTTIAVVCAVFAMLLSAGVIGVIMWLTMSDPSQLAHEPLVMDETVLKTCVTSNCKQVAKLFQESLSRTVDPCEDFYQYVCTGWKSAPSNKMTTIFGLHTKNITSTVIQALGNAEVPANDQTPYQKAAGLFQSCMTVMERGPSDEMKKEIVEFLRQRKAPFVTHSDVDAASLMIDFTFNYGIPVLFDISVLEPRPTANERYLTLNMRSSICRRHPVTPEAVKRHFVWLGLENVENEQSIAQTISTIDEFLTKLCRKTISSSSRPPAVTPIIPLNKFEKEIKGIKGDLWNSYMRSFTEGVLPGRYYLAVPRNHVKLFLSNVFQKIDSDFLRLWISWEVSRQLKQMITPSTSGSFQANDRLSQLGNQCLRYPSDMMNFATYFGFYETAVSNTTVTDATTMVASIGDSLYRKIEASTWLEEKTKNIALRKLKKMKKVVGFPEAAESDDSISEYYTNFMDMGSSFVTNWLQVSRAYTRKLIDRLTENPPVIRLNDNMLFVNAVYQPQFNTMIVPVSLLMPPFYGEIPAVNFGSVGHLAAHEMMHAFDVSSRMRDDNGIHRDWWAPSSRDEYEKRVKCIRDSVGRILPEGASTSVQDDIDSEAMSDFIGLPGLYDAYQVAKAQPEAQLFLQGMDDFTSDQLFFIAFCYKWCSNTRPSARYADFPVRCNMPLRNFPEFSDAFQCSADSAMNATNKCTFW